MDESKQENPKQALQQWLSHPLLLLLIGALISNYLIPSITQQWQNHEKELEIKTNLVGQINETVTSIIMAVQFAEVGARSLTQEEYDEAFREWEIKRAVIGSQIRAYYPQTEIGSEWDTYSEVITEIYALSGTTDPTFRADRLDRIRTYLGKNNVDWQILAKSENRQQNRQQFLQAWFSLKEPLLAKKNELVQQILDSPIASLS